MRRQVYIHERAEVPFWFGRDVLRDDPNLLISGADPGQAPGLGMGLQARLGFVHLVRPVTVSFGAFREGKSDGLCYRDLSWHAVEEKALFPVMDGELELSDLTSHRIQITFIGCYRPPFSFLGATIDAVALHRIAESSLEIWVRDAATALEEAWTESQSLGRRPALDQLSQP